jgi:cytochrome oxidase assembly protein ShyY1
LRTDEVRRLGQPSIPAGQTLTQVPRIEIASLQPQVEPELLPMFVEQIASSPADADSLQPIAFPELDDGPHLSYMVQWWIFATAAAVGWVLAVRRERNELTRRAVPPGPHSTPDVDAPATEPTGTPSTSSH